jgi:hypothetical protein
MLLAVASRGHVVLGLVLLLPRDRDLVLHRQARMDQIWHVARGSSLPLLHELFGLRRHLQLRHLG